MRDSNDYQVHLPTEEVIIRHRKGLVQKGLTNPWPEARGGQLLGTGAHGAAYDIGDRVLKLTHDYDEAMVSARIRGRSMRHVVKIYDVWSMPDSTRGDGSNPWDYKPWFAVTREKLLPLKKRDMDIMKVMFELYEDESLDLWVNNERTMVARWRTMLQGQLEHSGVTRAMSILRDVAAGAAELRTCGFDWTDFHDENILQNAQGTYKIVDVGWGEWRVNDIETPVPALSA
jgi:hypothetical protein